MSITSFVKAIGKKFWFTNSPEKKETTSVDTNDTVAARSHEVPDAIDWNSVDRVVDDSYQLWTHTNKETMEIPTPVLLPAKEMVGNIITNRETTVSPDSTIVKLRKLKEKRLQVVR